MSSGWSFGLADRFAAKEFAVGERLPYAYHLDAETLACRDGTLLQVIRIDGFSSETADVEELAYRTQIRETLLLGNIVAAGREGLFLPVARGDLPTFQQRNEVPLFLTGMFSEFAGQVHTPGPRAPPAHPSRPAHV